MPNMHNLTLASAKHLMMMGHITPEHHAKIVHAVKMKKMAFAKSPAPKLSFGSMKPQQAQVPIPAVGMPGPVPGLAGTPAGTSSGYDDGQ